MTREEKADNIELCAKIVRGGLKFKFLHLSEWLEGVEPPLYYINKEYPLRLVDVPFPKAPEGKKWHAPEYINQEMLNQGYRPLFIGEYKDEFTQYLSYTPSGWMDHVKGPNESRDVTGKELPLRTTAPLRILKQEVKTPWIPKFKEGEAVIAYGYAAYINKIVDDRLYIVQYECNGNKSSCPEDSIKSRENKGLPAEKKDESQEWTLLELSDIPPGSVVRGRVTMGHVVFWGTGYIVFGNQHSITLEHLFHSGFQINRSIPETGKWNPNAWESCCKKVKTEIA